MSKLLNFTVKIIVAINKEKTVSVRMNTDGQTIMRPVK